MTGKVVIMGLGSVARCTIPLLLEHLKRTPEHYTILDPNPSADALAYARAAGIKVVELGVERDNYMRVLGEYLDERDLLLDLAWNTGTIDILEWCSQHGVRFVNASLEVWDPYANADTLEPRDRTLYKRHMDLRARNFPKGGPTAVLDHGANPGLVSHFTKAALRDIALECLEDVPPINLSASGQLRALLERALENEEWALLAYHLGVKTIHISERDTQISDVPKRVGEFVNTWSVEGFYEEATAPAELGWGTHEATLPEGAQRHFAGPQNQIALSQLGAQTWARSWVPTYGEIVGMVIRHGEAFSISEHLTFPNTGGGKAIYRPTVHYVYCPSDAAIASLHELEMRRYQLQTQQRIMTDDIVSGRDELGVLLLGHRLGGWWYGSSLDISETRRLMGPGQNATTLQVAAAVLAAVKWADQNPHEGVCLPDDLPYEYVLDVARPYLGDVISTRTGWHPSRDPNEPDDSLGNTSAYRQQFDVFRVR